MTDLIKILNFLLMNFELDKLFSKSTELSGWMVLCGISYWCSHVCFISLKLQILKSFRHHAKACAPQNVQITCHPDRMELTFPATAVGGSQEQVEHEKIISVSVQDQFQDYFSLLNLKIKAKSEYSNLPE